MEHIKKGEVNLGTTIMAVQYADGVVIGADTRTTTGSYIANRVTDKLTSVSDYIYCCRSGSAADTQAVADIVQYYLQMYTYVNSARICRLARFGMEHGESPPVEVAANLFQQLVYGNKDALSAGIIVAGWDKYDGGSVYTVPLGGSIHKQPFSIGGSGSTYIYGYCDAKYKDNMTREECIDFTKNAIALAISRDGSSGGCIRLAVIDKQGVERIFVPGNEIPTFWEG